jgi:hypothetical protein
MPIIIQKCVKNWLEVALNSTKDPLQVCRMLTLQEFVICTGFKVDEFTMNKFYHNLDNELFIYMDKSIIEWFGYKGTIFKQKKRISNILNKIFRVYENKYWFEYSNKEYKILYSENQSESKILDIYPNPTEFKDKNKTKHMIIHPIIFKHIVLMADTKKSMEIRDCYITVEELIKKYTRYQSEVIKTNNINLQQMVSKISNTLEKSEANAESYRKKAESDKKKAEYERAMSNDLLERHIQKLLGHVDD